jgi:hypothetical protein
MPLGLDPTTAGKDLHTIGSPVAPRLPSDAPQPRTNIGNSPVHRSLEMAAAPATASPSGAPAAGPDYSSVQPDGIQALAPSTFPVRKALDQAAQRTVTIGGRQYVADPSRTPEGRRESAALDKARQLEASKSAERRSNLQTLRKSNPKKYADSTDAMIEAAASDETVYHQIVMPREDPVANHARERQFDVTHPLKDKTDLERKNYILRRIPALEKACATNTSASSFRAWTAQRQSAPPPMNTIVRVPRVQIQGVRPRVLLVTPRR